MASRLAGVSLPIFYKWKNKFSDMGVSEAKRLRLLEQENARMKKLIAEVGPGRRVASSRACSCVN